MNPLYFAFGSNLDAAQMRRRCPRAAAETSAVLRGYRLEFGGVSARWGGGVATLERDRASAVEGVLYRLPLCDLRALDIHEGVPFVYERVRVNVRDVLGRRRRAWTYVMPATDFSYRPSVPYLILILRAYVKYGFSRRALLLAANRSAA